MTELTEDRVVEIIKETVKTTLAGLGAPADTATAQSELQQDFAFLRKFRKAAGTLFLAFLTGAAAIGGIVQGFLHMLDKGGGPTP